MSAAEKTLCVAAEEKDEDEDEDEGSCTLLCVRGRGRRGDEPCSECRFGAGDEDMCEFIRMYPKRERETRGETTLIKISDSHMEEGGMGEWREVISGGEAVKQGKLAQTKKRKSPSS